MRFLRALRICVIVCSTASALGGLTPLEKRGKDIYMHGSSASGEMTASVDGGATRLPATTFPCASCHGRDGRGRTEGGVQPPDITWDALRRPYASVTATGRRHGPYDDHKLGRAVMKGVDSAGNALDHTMPRYSMLQSDLDALRTYMKKLGHEQDPGLTETTIRLGVVLPPQSTMPRASQETRAILEAWFADVNRGGGVHGRNYEVVFTDPAGTPEERARRVAEFVEKENVFALVSSFTEGAERELSDLAEAQEIPLIASLASNPRSSVAPGMYVRELFAGLTEQARALIRVAAREGTTGKRAAVASRDDRWAAVRDAAVEALRVAGFSESTATDDVSALRGYDVIVFLDEGLLRAFHAQDAGKTVTLVPASLAGPDLFAQNGSRALLSFATLPRDWSEAGLGTRARLAADRQIGRSHPAAQFAALASATLATDAIARAGRALTRDAFLAAIDQTRRFAPGFGPPFTFRPDRHLGSTGAYVLPLQGGQHGDPEWIDTEG